jgi:predicted enzyme related to lactoylglutathione lyase
MFNDTHNLADSGFNRSLPIKFTVKQESVTITVFHIESSRVQFWLVKWWHYGRINFYVHPPRCNNHKQETVMDLNQVTLPSTDMERSKTFYRELGLIMIVDSSHYARFECPDGDATFSIHAVSEMSGSSGVVIYFETQDLNRRVATAGGTEAARRAGSSTAREDNTLRTSTPMGR